MAVTVSTVSERRRTPVYAEEASSGARRIQAVGTAIAAFVGLAPEGAP
jgi:phage tail sheath protein FI